MLSPLIAILQKMILPFFDQISMRKDSGSIQTVALSIICSLNRVVARPAAAQERRPSRSAGGPQGRLAEPRKNKWKEVLVYIYSIPSAIELH